MKDRKYWMVTGVVGLLSGCMVLYSQIKSAAIKVLAVNEIESNLNTATINKQEAENLNPAPEPKNNRKIQDIIKANKADTFSGAWKVLPTKERASSILFATLTSIAMGCLTSLSYDQKTDLFKGQNALCLAMMGFGVGLNNK